MNQVLRKNYTEAKNNKAFRFKLLELCKTRTKKPSPDLFNFHVFSAGHDMVTDAGRATTRSRRFKATTVQKMKDLLKTRVLTGKQFEHFKTKNIKKSSVRMENKTKEPQDPKGKNWTWTKYSGRNKR